ncbi:MAG: FCD domain-containing protein, partial [Mesorhizobium sp.]
LPGERELARRFEVSRPILRAALKALEGRGLLTTRPGGGTHVADVIGQLFTKPVTDLISMHRKAATDYLEYRREIEAVAAEYAARRATSDDLALLDRIMARMDEAHRTGNFDDEAEIDVEFHHAICECAHNIILLHTLRSCYRLLSEGVFQNRLLVFNVPGAREALLSQHRAIYAAVKAGDPAAARQAAMDHITHVERTMAEAERSGDWQRVSRLRLMQRSEAGDSEPARKRS